MLCWRLGRWSTVQRLKWFCIQIHLCNGPGEGPGVDHLRKYPPGDFEFEGIELPFRLWLVVLVFDRTSLISSRVTYPLLQGRPRTPQLGPSLLDTLPPILLTIPGFFSKINTSTGQYKPLYLYVSFSLSYSLSSSSFYLSTSSFSSSLLFFLLLILSSQFYKSVSGTRKTKEKGERTSTRCKDFRNRNITLSHKR